MTKHDLSEAINHCNPQQSILTINRQAIYSHDPGHVTLAIYTDDRNIDRRALLRERLQAYLEQHGIFGIQYHVRILLGG